jgi:hypothetical protein
MAAIYRSIADDAAVIWARLGFYLLIIGTALTSIQFALGAGAVSEGAKATPDTGMILLAATIYVRSFGIMITWIALAWIGIGMLKSKVYTKWIGWSIAMLGSAMVNLCGIYIITEVTLLKMAVSGLLAKLTAIWAVVLGIWIMRHRLEDSA